ncbi:hypothetical protein ABMA10_20570 [Plantibacter sp. RU18]
MESLIERILDRHFDALKRHAQSCCGGAPSPEL